MTFFYASWPPMARDELKKKIEQESATHMHTEAGTDGYNLSIYLYAYASI